MITVDRVEMMEIVMQRFLLTAMQMVMQRLTVDPSWQLMHMDMAVAIATMQIAGWSCRVTRTSELVPKLVPRKETPDRNRGPNPAPSLAVPGGAVRGPSLDPGAMTDRARNRARNLVQARNLEDLVTTPT